MELWKRKRNESFSYEVASKIIRITEKVQLEQGTLATRDIFVMLLKPAYVAYTNICTIAGDRP
jgi:hypothetical protein